MKYISCYLCILFFLVGCGRQLPVVQKLAPLPVQGSCSIAVLPFLNESTYAQGGAIVNKVFLSELAGSGHFQILQEGDVLDLYQQLFLYPNQLPNREQLKMMGGRLNPDLFVGGVVQKMATNKTGNFVDTELTLILLLYDGKSGEMLWTTYHRRLGEEYQQILHLGRINTITGLVRRMSQEIITDWFKQGMTPCTE